MACFPQEFTHDGSKGVLGVSLYRYLMKNIF